MLFSTARQRAGTALAGTLSGFSQVRPLVWSHNQIALNNERGLERFMLLEPMGLGSSKLPEGALPGNIQDTVLWL